MVRSNVAALSAALALALAGCSGMGGMGGGGSSMTPSAPQQAPAAAAPAEEPESHENAAEPETEAATPEAATQAKPLPLVPAGTPLGRGGKNPANAAGINAVNALSSPVKTYTDENANEPGAQAAAKHAVTRAGKPFVRPGKGVCHDGIEFFSPDQAGDPNSTETRDFYDAACTQLARDIVRKWTAGSTAGSETVLRTVDDYAPGGTTPIAVATNTTNFTNATFTTYGFPVVASGFQRETSGQLAVGTKKNVLSDSETVLQPSTSNVNQYCTDSAGYNALGIAKLGLEFGWNGGAFSGGTRTLNADTSVTWNATHTGQTESGPIGALGIATGSPNTTCPIVTPAYTLTGGTAKGTYTIPISITFKYGVIRNLTVTNATLASGNTLNVTTNGSVWPANSNFINGTVANGSKTIATFSVSAFGNGTLTVAATGNQFAITDWNVVR